MRGDNNSEKYFIITYLCVCRGGGSRGSSDPLELELQTVESCLLLVPGLKLRDSAEAIHSLNH